MKIIEVSHLKKGYDQVRAVNDVSFYVNEGELFAFLGSNGAGKSTTIHILCTLLKPDDGHVIIKNYQLNKDDIKIKQAIGIVFQNHVLDDLLTVKENLITRASLYYSSYQEMHQAVQNVMKDLNIEKYANRLYGTLSGGQKRCCDIARAVIHQPQILFLDEPTTGLHTADIHQLLDVLQRLVDGGDTVVVIEHNLDVIKTADYLIDLGPEGGNRGGTIVAKGTPEDITKVKASYTGQFLKPLLEEGKRLNKRDA